MRRSEQITSARSAVRRRSRKGPPGGKQPNYNLGVEFVELAFRLMEPRRYVTVDEIQGWFSFANRRRAQRWLAALRWGVFNGETHPALLRLEDVERREITIHSDIDSVMYVPETKIFRGGLVYGKPSDTGLARMVPVFLAFSTLKYFEGIIPKDTVETLWRKMSAELAPSELPLFSSLERKLYAVPYAPKRYAERSEILDIVLDALLRQHVLRVDYYGLHGSGHTHRFEPWTLAMYKGGLYLLGKSDRRAFPIYLAVERIDAAEKLFENGFPVPFVTPATYSPADHFQGLFGIVEGEETEVELEIQNRETEERLKEREIHPTQQFHTTDNEGRDGYRKARLTVRLRGTAEFVYWILSLGKHVSVIRPVELRARVESLLRETLALYSK